MSNGIGSPPHDGGATFASCTKDDLDKFVIETDLAGGPESPTAAMLWTGFTYKPSVPIDETLDPCSEQYLQQQIRLHREISGRALNQAETELTEFEIAPHLSAVNSYAVSDPVRMAVHFHRLSKLIKCAAPPRAARILDLGCGWGLSSEFFATIGCRVTAVDINADFVELVRLRSARLNLGIEVIHSNFDALHFTERFDLIVFYESLHHSVKPWELLQKASSWLEPNGQIALAGEPIQSDWWRNWGLRLDPLSVYCMRKRGWFESGWSRDFVERMFRQCELHVDYIDDNDPDIGPILIASRTNLQINDRQFVADLYRLVLSREPDEKGLSGHVDALRSGKSIGELLADFLSSAEYQDTRKEEATREALSALAEAPAMAIDENLTLAERNALWAHVAETWSKLGTSEPYWSVLVDPIWKKGRMVNDQSLNSFYESGRADIERLDSWLARNNVSAQAAGICAEFGCGVGRCTVWLARRFKRVIAFDISEPHLLLAKARTQQEGLHNVDYVHLKSIDDLQSLKNIDFFYSIIVLQHNPPPVTLSILNLVFKRLNSGGIAFFQVPTYSLGYKFNLREYLGTMKNEGMEMHFVPQRSIFQLASSANMKPLEASPDGAIGHFGRWISTSFLMVKA